MIHKKCGGKLVLDCTSLYLIQSPSVKISSRGIFPGIIQIDSNKVKSTAKLICSKCQEVFSSKDEYEDGILEPCSICGNSYPPSEIKVTDCLSNVCVHCIELANSSKLSSNKIKDKMLMLYGEILNKADSPTLLTILMKK